MIVDRAEHAQSVRVVQRNLVYAVGLSMDICHEDILRSSEYFGQFGKPVKVRVRGFVDVILEHRTFTDGKGNEGFQSCSCLLMVCMMNPSGVRQPDNAHWSRALEERR